MNKVKRMSVPEPQLETYPLGTLIQVENDGRGFSGGIYMLASAGEDHRAVLVNLAFGTNRNGQLFQEDNCCGVTAEVLLDNIHGVKFHVVKSVIITAED